MKLNPEPHKKMLSRILRGPGSIPGGPVFFFGHALYVATRTVDMILLGGRPLSTQARDIQVPR